MVPDALTLRRSLRPIANRVQGVVAKIAVGIGTNLGDRIARLGQAIEDLIERFDEVQISSIYESPPMYVENQPAFLNMAVIAKTTLGPREILRKLKGIEADIGRVARDRNGPREIDLDLLAYGSLILKSEGEGLAPLILPHPRMLERRFVLDPLIEINPEFTLPGIGPLALYLATADIQAQTVVRLDDAALPLHRDDA